MQWIESGLAVRFDEDFRMMLSEARQANDFEDFLGSHAYWQDTIDNMDY